MDIHVSCKKGCKFEIDWKDCPSIEHAEEFYKNWNKKYEEEMECIHDYIFTIQEKNDVP